MQRAEPACLDKFTRARLACEAGADLVLELPCAWATGVSERFARGALSLFAGLGCVDTLSFGSESGDRAAILAAAQAVADPAVIEQIAALCATGLPYPAAQQRAVADRLGAAAAAPFGHPNDLLAVDYCKAIAALGCAIEPCAVKRIGIGHDAANPAAGYASASFIRAGLAADGADFAARAAYLPPYVLAALQAARAADSLSGGLDALDRILLLKLRTMTQADCRALPDCGSGLGDRLYRAAGAATSFATLCEAAKTKRYTMSRVRRAALHAALGITGACYAIDPPYLRILAIGEGGNDLLRTAKRTATLPLSHSLKRLAAYGGDCAAVAALEAAAGELYAMSLPHPPARGADYTTKLPHTGGDAD